MVGCFRTKSCLGCFCTKCCLYLLYVDGMPVAFSGQPCGPAHSASYDLRPARWDVPLPAGCFRPGALRVASPRPRPAPPGSLDAMRRDLAAGYGCLEEGGGGTWGT